MSDYYAVFENVKYYKVDDFLIVGDNTSSAIFDSSQPIRHLFIPMRVNDYDVTEIGRTAFYDSESLESITIEARIKQINPLAFGYCRSLLRVNIPNTCEYIFAYGLQTYNSTYGGYRPNPYKQLDVYFEANSKIKLFDDHAFGYREHINIYTCTPINPELHEKAFIASPNVKVYSPYLFSFGKYKSTTKNYSSQCYRLNTCHRPNVRHSQTMCYIITVLLSIV